MNKNNIIGFLLIAVVLIGFSWYNQPSAEEQRAAFVQDSIAKAKHAEMEKCLDDVLVAEGWDKETLAMPEGLRQLRDDMLG